MRVIFGMLKTAVKGYAAAARQNQTLTISLLRGLEKYDSERIKNVWLTRGSLLVRATVLRSKECYQERGLGVSTTLEACTRLARYMPVPELRSARHPEVYHRNVLRHKRSIWALVSRSRGRSKRQIQPDRIPGQTIP